MRAANKKQVLADAFSVLVLLSLSMGTGCHKQAAKSNTPVEVAKVPEVMNDAFRDATPELRTQITAVEDATRKQDPTAVSGLLDLMHRTDLTPEQRAAANRCLPPLLNAAREAAAQGDQRAADALSAYHASK